MPTDTPPLTPAAGAAGNDRSFFGHPRGLSTLFFTEMWERFSFYGLRALLMIFMTKTAMEGGLGFDAKKAGVVLGVYLSSVYLLSLPGGWIADKFLGARKAVFTGGLLIMSGHICLAIPSELTFFIGLSLIALGTGLLKPNISTMVGQLYTREDIRRDSGYSIFYMGINLGAFVAPLICGYVAQSDTFRDVLKSAGISPTSSWHFAFALAAVGMGLGLLQYVFGKRHLGQAGLIVAPAADAADAARRRRTLGLIAGAVLGMPMLVLLLASVGVISLSPHSVELGMGAILTVMSIVLFIKLFQSAESKEERNRMKVILVLFIGAAIFFACFDQAASTLSSFAENNTATTFLGMDFPSSWFQSLNPIFVIVLAPVFAAVWLYFGKQGKEPSSPAKFGAAMFMVAGGLMVLVVAANFAKGGVRVSPAWLMTLYLVHTCAELCLSPVGLSSMSKLAPARMGSMVMGIWFLGTSIGSFVAGISAGLAANASLQSLFTTLSVVAVIAGVLLYLLAGPIKRMLAADGAARPAGH